MHVEGEHLPAEGVETQGMDGGNAEAEAVHRRTLPSPYMPTLSEIRQHKTTHLPYRSWCDECVEAFAREWPHLHRSSPSGRTIPVIHMDYACLTEKGLFRLDELSEEDLEHAVLVIVGYCSSSRSPFIHVVPSKATSNDKFAAERIVDDIVYLGHTRVILRSDNEPALLALVTDALKGLRIHLLDSAAAEGSVPYDPQTAGAAEVLVRNLKGQVRAMHLTLDHFMDKHVPVTHPLIAWLVEHAAFVRLTGVIGQDGMSAYHRIRGTEHKLRLPFFGEKVWYNCRSQRVASPAKDPGGATGCSSASTDAQIST